MYLSGNTTAAGTFPFHPGNPVTIFHTELGMSILFTQMQ
jgi:hypothetical protein